MKASQTARKHPRLRNSKWPRVVTAGSVKVKIYRISPKEGTPFYQIADYSLGRRRLRSVASETSALDQARQLAAKMARGEVGAAQLTHQQAASYARAIDSLETTGDPIELAAARYAEAVSQLGGQSSLLLHAYAEVIPEEKWGQSVPAGAPAGAPIWMVQTTWQGGITPINGDTTGETERQFQRIGMAQDDGKVTPVVPFAITDLGDPDNHHELWVAGPGVPLWVEMDSEIVQDPRGDPNAADRIFIAHP